MYKIYITPKARREIKKISENHQKAVILALRELKEDPFVGKPLREKLIRKFSYRVGAYRIIFVINEKEKAVSILTAGHRANIYS